jgi:flagellar biosynthesis chaperone FliJ
MAKNEKQKLARYARLLDIDQRRLDSTAERLRQANAAVARVQKQIDDCNEERTMVLNCNEDYMQVDLRVQTGVWMEWSEKQLKRLQAERVGLEKIRDDVRAEYMDWKMRVKAWETLIGKVQVKIAALESRRDQAMADEIVLRKTDFLDFGNGGTSPTIHGLMGSTIPVD